MPARKKSSIKKVSPARKSARKISNPTERAVTQSSSTTSQMVTMKTYLKNPRLWVGVGVIVVAILLFMYKGLFVAAIVNGQPISRLAVVSALEKQGGKQALDNLVVESLVTQEAQKRNITVSQSDINDQLNKIEAQLKTQGMTLDDALAAQGLSKSDLMDQLKIQEMLTKMVGGQVSVSDADVQSYINNNQDSLPKNLSDADLKAQVKSQLEQQQLQTKTQALISQLQKNAKISYFVSY